jgi:16S rRNA (guanine1207-N2)-methyltransferase
LPRPLLAVGDDAVLREATHWCRHITPWPPDGPFASAVLRLPLDKGAYEMALHAIAARLPRGAPLLVYGPNDEGIKSAPKAFSPFYDEAETIAAKGHARIWRATRTAVMEGLRGTLAEWRKVAPLMLEGRARDWVSYPGVFAKGGLDAGTALLLRHLPEAGGKTALDFGTGTGVVARVLADLGARVTMIERDAVALEAARENVPEAQPILGSALPEGRFDLIISNPPVHAGKAKNLTVLAALIGNARQHLRKGGALVIVVQQTVPVARLAEGHSAAQILAEEGGYRVWALRQGVLRVE